MLDTAAVFAYLGHEEEVATTFFHESFYLLAFFIPPYFLAKYINRDDLVAATKEYQLMKSRKEQY